MRLSRFLCRKAFSALFGISTTPVFFAGEAVAAPFVAAEPQGVPAPEVKVENLRTFAPLSEMLQRCQVVLKGLEASTPEARQSEALFECSRVLEIASSLVQSPQTRLSAPEKSSLLKTCEQTMLLLEVFIRRRKFQTETTLSLPTLAQATSVENQLRLVLSALHAHSNWSLTVSGAAGASRYLDRNTVPKAGAQFSVLVDHGNQFEAGLKFRLMTPLREEAPAIEFPPREIDALGVSQLWIAFTRYRNVNLKVGIFPDQEGYANPAEWPFVSVQGGLKIISLPYLYWNSRLRHDVLGTYSTTQQTPRATLVERTLWQNTVGFETATALVTLQGRAHLSLHWYTDPNGQVASLSFGRGHYLNEAPASSNTRYRISETLFEVSAAFEERWTAKAGYQSFHNFLLDSQNRGWLVRAQPSVKWAQNRVGVTLQRSVLQCASVPPVQIASTLLPGTASNSASLEAEFPISQGVSATLWATKYRSKVLLQKDLCSPNVGSQLRSQMLDGSFGTSVSYAFPEM